MKKTAVKILLCTLIAVAGGAIAAVGTFSRQAAKDAKAAAFSKEEKLPNVKVQLLKGKLVEDRLQLTGAIEPWESRILSAEVAGKIAWRGVEEGDRVAAGQELFRIDTESLRAHADQLEAQFKLAGQELDRIDNLTTKGVIGTRDLDKAQAERDMASAGLHATKLMLAKSTLRAPLDGIVDRLFSKADEFTDVGNPLVRIVQVAKVKALVSIPERDTPYFKIGDKVRIRPDALPDQEFEGVIHRLATSAELTTRTFDAEVALDNADGVLKPGMIVRATLIREAFPDSLLIPIFSLISLEDKRIVFVETNGAAEVRSVETGILQGSSVQITKGLSPGDKLIIVGQRDLRPGEKVNVLEVMQ